MLPKRIAPKLNQIYSDLNYIVDTLPPILKNPAFAMPKNGTDSDLVSLNDDLVRYDVQNTESESTEVGNFDLKSRAIMLRSLVKITNFEEKIFDDDQFHDPVWDMFIELALATSTGRQISVTSLAAASHAPPSSAVRYIDIMVKKGIFEKSSITKIAEELSSSLLKKARKNT